MSNFNLSYSFIKKFNFSIVIAFAIFFFFLAPSPSTKAAIEFHDGDSVSDELEKELAEKFAPVLHKHPLDLQENLADFNETLSNHSILKAYSLTTGALLYNQRTPSVHVYSLWHWDSLGVGSIGTYWMIDIDDSYSHKGASEGKRPLYYHVYKDDNYYYVQYWYFFNMNDLSDQTEKGTWHEGDWEHVTLRVKFNGEHYLPDAINFHQHYGGHTVLPSEAWWSSGYGKNFGPLVQGYRESYIPPCRLRVLCKPFVTSLTHLHIWIGRNSHASFNRFDDIYVADSPGNHFEDDVEYYDTDTLFEYDTLVNMGEVTRSPTKDGWDFAHNQEWLSHYEHHRANNSPSLDGLAFVGDIGEYWESNINRITPPGCKDAVTASPRSPFFNDMFHEWLSFTHNTQGFGNNDIFCIQFLNVVDISWIPFADTPKFRITPKILEFYDFASSVPSFEIDMQDGLYYSIEITTDNVLFDNTNHTYRNESNFFSSWWGSSSLDTLGSISQPIQDRTVFSNFIFSVPKSFWDHAEIGQKLYYRLLVSIDKNGDQRWLTTVDDEWFNAPFITILAPIFGDLNGDQCVDRSDLSLLINQIRSKKNSSEYDINNDGKVNIADARRLVTLFSLSKGKVCE